jgi:threonine dehydrogenase-like Zn-dependent dehydrogenase
VKALVFRHSLAREAASAIGGRVDLTPVITHRFPLARWDEAVLTVKDSRRTGAVKVLLDPAC